MMTKLKTVIGLMSGTSMDGIDAALIRTDGRKQVKGIAWQQFSYPDSFRLQLKAGLVQAENIIRADERPGNLRALEERVTLYHADAVKKLVSEAGHTFDDIDLIGFHGQTLLHRPQQHLSVQIGDGALLAAKTGIDVICDMRRNDIQHGGDGAPLVPVYHRALSYRMRKVYPFPLVFVNIGGIANLTWIDAAGNLAAFDCGPGNVLLDQWTEAHTGGPFDRDGEAGLRGKVDEQIAERYLGQVVSARKKRRSFDWRDFPPLEKDAAAQDNGAATLATVTALCIVRAFDDFPCNPKTVIVSGGGARNRAIMQALIQRIIQKGIKVLTAADAGMNADLIEAEAWAYLAVRSFYNLPLSYPSTTGCERPVSGGVLIQAVKNRPD